MSTQSASRTITYPDDDGLPLSDNTRQYEWITKLVGGLQRVFRDHPDVFVAGNLLWYPVEGDNLTRIAPDAMVAFGRPKKDYRGSYKQWCEDGIAPQVVFEVLSPGNRPGEMADKLAFYDHFGVEEYYVLDPEPSTLEGWRRTDGTLTPIDMEQVWTSPLLGIQFERIDNELRISGPDGSPFETYIEVVQHVVEERQRADDERRRADDERRRADDERRRADDERRRADRLLERLRALGIDPDA
jgi:Uma2 family endonuclease